MKMPAHALLAILLIVAFALALVLSLLAVEFSRPGCTSPLSYARLDAYYYAQVARNVLRGRGFTTDLIFPVTVTRFGLSSAQPDTLHPPLYTASLAVAMLCCAKSIWSVTACSTLFYIAAIVITFLLAVRAFGLSVASVSCVLLAANPWFLKSILQGDDPLSAALFMLLLWSLHCYDDRSTITAALPGAFLGLCYLNRYSSMLFLLPLLWYVSNAGIPGKGSRRVMAAAAGFAAVISPWLIRNLIAAGGPFATLAWLRDLVLQPGFRNLLTTDPRWSVRHLSSTFVTAHLTNTSAALVTLTGNFLMPVFIASLFHKFRDARFARLRMFVYLCMGIMILFHFAYSWSPESDYLIFFPFIIVVSVAFFFELLTRDEAWGNRIRPLAVSALLVLNLIPLFGIYDRVGGGTCYAGFLDPLLRYDDRTRPLISDAAHLITWYYDRKAIMLSPDVAFTENIKELSKLGPAILLSNTLSDYEFSPDRVDQWHAIWESLMNHIPTEAEGYTNALIWKENVLLY